MVTAWSSSSAAQLGTTPRPRTLPWGTLMASPKYRVWFHLTAAAHEEFVSLGSPQPSTTRLATPKIKRELAPTLA
jgi:hypothetical protein